MIFYFTNNTNNLCNIHASAVVVGTDYNLSLQLIEYLINKTV